MRPSITCHGTDRGSSHPGLAVYGCESYSGVCEDCYDLFAGRLSLVSKTRDGHLSVADTGELSYSSPMQARTPVVTAKARELLDAGSSTYKITSASQGRSGSRSITCLLCDMTSFSRKDVSKKYCGNCHVFHEDIRVAHAILNRNEERIEDEDLD